MSGRSIEPLHGVGQKHFEKTLLFSRFPVACLCTALLYALEQPQLRLKIERFKTRIIERHATGVYIGNPFLVIHPPFCVEALLAQLAIDKQDHAHVCGTGIVISGNDLFAQRNQGRPFGLRQ